MAAPKPAKLPKLGPGEAAQKTAAGDLVRIRTSARESEEVQATYFRVDVIWSDAKGRALDLRGEVAKAKVARVKKAVDVAPLVEERLALLAENAPDPRALVSADAIRSLAIDPDVPEIEVVEVEEPSPDDFVIVPPLPLMRSQVTTVPWGAIAEGTLTLEKVRADAVARVVEQFERYKAARDAFASVPR